MKLKRLSISFFSLIVAESLPLLMSCSSFSFLYTSEYSKAKSCIRELLNEECPTNKGSRTLHMDVLFDGYNPFCINRIYQPPTTVTTAPREHEQNTKQPKQPSNTTPRRNTLAKSGTSYNKLYFNIYLQILLASLSAGYV